MTAWLPDGLNMLECAVLTLMLDTPGELQRRVREQLAIASAGARDLTGAGFYRNFVIPPDASLPRDLADTTFCTVTAEHPELEGGAMFVLFLRDGLVCLLEGVTYEGSWPSDEDSFTLFLDPEIDVQVA